MGRGKLEYADHNNLITAARLLGIGVHVQFLGHITEGQFAGRSVLRVVPLDKQELEPVEAKLRNLRLRAGRIWDTATKKVALATETPTKENNDELRSRKLLAWLARRKSVRVDTGYLRQCQRGSSDHEDT